MEAFVLLVRGYYQESTRERSRTVVNVSVVWSESLDADLPREAVKCVFHWGCAPPLTSRTRERSAGAPADAKCFQSSSLPILAGVWRPWLS